MPEKRRFPGKNPTETQPKPFAALLPWLLLKNSGNPMPIYHRGTLIIVAERCFAACSGGGWEPATLLLPLNRRSQWDHHFHGFYLCRALEQRLPPDFHPLKCPIYKDFSVNKHPRRVSLRRPHVRCATRDVLGTR